LTHRTESVCRPRRACRIRRVSNPACPTRDSGRSTFLRRETPLWISIISRRHLSRYGRRARR
jgi:hypothetical protein